jgi:hypothetical protein
VRRIALTALMIWALCFVGADCGSATIQSPGSSNLKTEALPASPVLTLTNDQPKNSLPIKASELASDVEVLEVTITKVINPSLTPLSIFVYLSDSEKGKSRSKEHLVGNFSLYPPDQPGKFLLSAAPGLRKVLAEGPAKGNDVRLVFEMKRIHETSAWTPVEVTIAQPAWRAAEK